MVFVSCLTFLHKENTLKATEEYWKYAVTVRFQLIRNGIMYTISDKAYKTGDSREPLHYVVYVTLVSHLLAN